MCSRNKRPSYKVRYIDGNEKIVRFGDNLYFTIAKAFKNESKDKCNRLNIHSIAQINCASAVYWEVNKPIHWYPQEGIHYARR